MPYLFYKFHSNLYLLSGSILYSLSGSLLSTRVSLPSRCAKRLVNTCMSKNIFQMSFRELMDFGNFRLSCSERKSRSEKAHGLPGESIKARECKHWWSQVWHLTVWGILLLRPLPSAEGSEFSGDQHCNQQGIVTRVQWHCMWLLRSWQVCAVMLLKHLQGWLSSPFSTSWT